MPVQFLTAEQRANYGRFVGEPSSDDLTRYFYLDDADRSAIDLKRGQLNRLGYALQLTTVRFLGTFLENPTEVPESVVRTLAQQLQIEEAIELSGYLTGEQKREHAMEIQAAQGLLSWTDRMVGFRLSRWLYALCWTGTEQPGVLFDRATTWLLAHRVILPGCTTLERFVSRVRSRVENRLWSMLGRGITTEQQTQLEKLLTSPDSGRGSWLERLRSGPVRVSGRSLFQAIQRLKAVRSLGIKLPETTIPPNRLASLARFAGTAKITAILRLPNARRLATLVAFVSCLEATAQDDALEVLEVWLHEIFNDAAKANKKTRLRSLKDLDKAASVLASVCRTLLEVDSLDPRDIIFANTPPTILLQAVARVDELVRPPDDVYFSELDARYRSVRVFLPALLENITFGSNATGQAVVSALDWLRSYEMRIRPQPPLPTEIITGSWDRHVKKSNGALDYHAYSFCALDGLRKALKRRDIFVAPSWRYADPRAGLLAGAEWEATRTIVCRSLDISSDPKQTLDSLSIELDQTYREVVENLPRNPSVRFEMVGDKKELVLSQLDKLEEPKSLVALRAEIASRLPRVDLPEILLEISASTGFTDSFTHVTERTARAHDLATSLCAVLLAEACNTGPEPLIRQDVPALRRERLAWVSQNYLRDDTLVKANASLVAAQSRITLAKAWGGGEVASADGIRFVVPVRTVHAGPNPKYFGFGRGVTWYNLLSDQCTGLNAITVPGTLRDSLILLAVVLEQQTEVQPTRIMTDTGAYSDVVFGLFRLLGYRFCPRLADIGGTRFWRIDPKADYGDLNAIARNRVSLTRIEANWDDLLRLAGSLKLGRVPATGIMRTLQVGDNLTQLALALADYGRIDKTIHCLKYINDEQRRRATLVQLNRGESRHSLARSIFHGKRGELRKRYREGQEDQLGALGLVVNMIVLWNTIYIEAALNQLRLEGYSVRDEDVARLSPFIHDHHINLLGRYTFAVPEEVIRGELRPLRNPNSGDA